MASRRQSEMSSRYSNRVLWIDAARGLAIFLVILGHTVQFGSQGKFDFFSNPLFIFIYSFHMPLFVFLSGFVSAHGIYASDQKHFLRRRFEQLMIPMINWSLVGGMATWLALALLSRSFDFLRLLHIELGAFKPYNSLWFLWCIFFINVIVALVRRASIRYRSLILILLVPIIWILPHSIGFQLQWLYPFFVAGVLISRVKELSRRYETACVLLASAMFVALIALWQRNYSVYIQGMSLLNDDLYQTCALWIYRYSLAAIAILSVLGGVRALSQKFRVYPLIKLGQFSLGIYCLQTFIFRVIQVIPSPSANQSLYFGVYVPIVACLVTVICYSAVNRISSRGRKARRYFLGEKPA